MEDSISVILPIYNQEELVKPVIMGIFDNMSENVKELIVVIDGCTDKSEEVVNSLLPIAPIPVHITHAPDIGEILSTNIAFKMSKCKYSLTIQDDMVTTEKQFDKRMLKPFKAVQNLFAVTSRNAQDETIGDDGISLVYMNPAGMDVNTSRDLFCIRDVIVRGQILWDNEKLKALNYLDEILAPQSEDDKEISLRAYVKYGWLVGAYRSDYISKREWGTSRKNYASYVKWENSMRKNQRIIIERYRDYFSGEKHDQDIIIK